MDASATRQRQSWTRRDSGGAQQSPGRGGLALPRWLLSAADEKWASQPTVRLLNDTEVELIRREPYITSGYLPSGSVSLCLRALFLPNNELFNSWSALLPALYYLRQLYCASPAPAAADPRPYQLLLLSVALSSLASFLAHAFSAVSPLAGQLLYGLDYAGIGLLGLAMTVAEHAYGGAASGGLLATVLLPAAALLALLGCAAACWSRLGRCQHQGQRLRLRGQAALFLWSAAAGRWSALRCAAALAAAAAVVAYASRWPERRWPGRWDVLGHSHGTFHLLTQLAAGCCVAAVRAQLEATSAGRPAPDVRWWVEVGYGRVAAALVATAAAFTLLCATAERRGKQVATQEGLAVALPPPAGDPEIKANSSDVPATRT